MQIELLKDNAIEFRGKFCYMWLMVLKPIYKQFIESCICPMLYRKSDVTLLYGIRHLGYDTKFSPDTVHCIK